MEIQFRAKKVLRSSTCLVPFFWSAFKEKTKKTKIIEKSCFRLFFLRRRLIYCGTISYKLFSLYRRQKKNMTKTFFDTSFLLSWLFWCWSFLLYLTWNILTINKNMINNTFHIIWGLGARGRRNRKSEKFDISTFNFHLFRMIFQNWKFPIDMRLWRIVGPIFGR